MTEVVLHIGISKTGSSAIQFGLAKHHAALAACGVHYAAANADEVVESHKISSGNGGPLAKLLMGANAAEGAFAAYDAAAFEDAFVAPELPVALISSEGLANADAQALADFRRRVLGERPVRIIAFVRDIYEHAVSSWMQRIKRHGYTDDFLQFCREKYSNKQCSALRVYAEVFGPSALVVVHYDPVRETVFDAFLEALGVAWRPDDQPPQINRSLSTTEVAVLRQCNAALRKRATLSQLISDHLIGKRPLKPKASIRSAKAAAYLARKFGDEIAWANETFFHDRETLKVGAAAPGDAEGEPEGKVWLDVVEALGLEVLKVRTQNARLRTNQTELKQMLAAQAINAPPTTGPSGHRMGVGRPFLRRLGSKGGSDPQP